MRVIKAIINTNNCGVSKVDIEQNIRYTLKQFNRNNQKVRIFGNGNNYWRWNYL